MDHMKQVNLPIIVPSGSYCWKFSGEEGICPHFDNGAAPAACMHGFWQQVQKAEGVLKDPRCASLGKA
jgi:hypothetical protein